MLCSGCHTIGKLGHRGKLKQPKCDWKPAVSKLPVILLFILHTKVARSTWNDEIIAYFILNYYQSHWLEGRREETHSLSQELLAKETCSKLPTKPDDNIRRINVFVLHGGSNLDDDFSMIMPVHDYERQRLLSNKQTNKQNSTDYIVLKEENTHFK